MVLEKGTQTKLIVDELKKQWKKVLLLDYPRYWEKWAYFVEQYLNGKYGTSVSAKRASLFYALEPVWWPAWCSEYFLRLWLLSSQTDMYLRAWFTKLERLQIQMKEWSFLIGLPQLEFEICWIPNPDKVLLSRCTTRS